MCYNVKNKQIKQGQFRGLEVGGDLSIWERGVCKNNGKKAINTHCTLIKLFPMRIRISNSENVLCVY